MNDAPQPLEAGIAGQRPPAEVNWRRNLVVVWVSQLFSIGAFSFTLPLVPLYLKEAGLVPPNQVNNYAAWFQTCTSIALMIMSPIWGALGDRFGRKMMLVRANLGGAVALYLMGVAANVHWLLALRVFQGAFTGTTAAAQTLVSCHTPASRQALALGMMAAAVALGDLFGRWMGAEAAAQWGVPAAFKISGAVLLFSTLLVAAFAQERFAPPLKAYRRRQASLPSRWRTGLRAMWRWNFVVVPLMIAFALLGVIGVFDSTVFSLYVDEIGTGLPRLADLAPQARTGWAYRTTGRVMVAAALASTAGSLLTGWVLDRFRGRGFIVLATLLLAGGLMGTAFGRELPRWLGFSEASQGDWVVPTLLLMRIGMGFGFAAVNSAQLVWAGRSMPPERRGTVFGATVTARAVGWASGPMGAAHAANRSGYSMVYVEAAAITLMLLPLLLWLANRLRASASTSTPAAAGGGDAIPSLSAGAVGEAEKNDDVLTPLVPEEAVGIQSTGDMAAYRSVSGRWLARPPSPPGKPESQA